MNKFIILDRDGVINLDSEDCIRTVDAWTPIHGSLHAIALFKQKGFTVTVATNQSGLGRGYFTAETLAAIHARFKEQVQQYGGEIAQINYCPHIPEDNCACRKPQIGLIRDLFTKFQINPRRDIVYLVGDSERDIKAAIAANCQPILVKTGNGNHTLQRLPVDLNIPVYENLLAFAESL